MSKASFHKIGIIGRTSNPGVIPTLNLLIDFLHRLEKTTFLDDETASALNNPTLKSFPRPELGKHCDLIIVVGGDGSLLSAAQTLIEYEVPVVGINRGSLGFLTDILPTELEKIAAIMAGKFTLEKRFLLTATVICHDKVLSQGLALNEFTLIPDDVPHMLEFDIFIDEQLVCSQRSDGLIIATPTGSTAYALSANGPILHPSLDAVVLVPMFPHTLSMRPLVVNANHEIRVTVTHNKRSSPRLACDGQTYINLPPDSYFTVSKTPHQLHLVHPLDYNYYETLRSKLHWGHKLYYSE